MILIYSQTKIFKKILVDPFNLKFNSYINYLFSEEIISEEIKNSNIYNLKLLYLVNIINSRKIVKIVIFYYLIG